jgi:hypothetical protein
VAPATPTFNQGLIVGNTPIITNAERVRQYATLSAVLSDFGSSAPEYLAAQEYFGQTPAPVTLWIGLQDTTAVLTLSPDVLNGTGYAVGDTVTVVQGGASGCTAKVTTIGSSGVVTGLLIITQGTGYSVASALTTTGGTGSGLKVDITAVGETPLQALQACRNVNGFWWAAVSTTAVDNDQLAIGAWVQGVTPNSSYIATVSDSTVLAELQTPGYGRILSVYSTTQGSAYPDNAYAAAGFMGRAMGLNTGLANSYFTMKFKDIAGVAPEPLTVSEVAAIEALNGNVLVSYANGSYTWIEQGKMANGQYFDEVLALDMLASDITYSLVNLLTSTPSIPQTNSGQSQLITVVAGACDRAVTRGFIAPAIWEGQQVLNLLPGQALPNGYLVQSESYSKQSTSDRQARKSMPIYVTLCEAGAVHSITVGVYVQR